MLIYYYSIGNYGKKRFKFGRIDQFFFYYIKKLRLFISKSKSTNEIIEIGLLLSLQEAY